MLKKNEVVALSLWLSRFSFLSVYICIVYMCRMYIYHHLPLTYSYSFSLCFPLMFFILFFCFSVFFFHWRYLYFFLLLIFTLTLFFLSHLFCLSLFILSIFSSSVCVCVNGVLNWRALWFNNFSCICANMRIKLKLAFKCLVGALIRYSVLYFYGC